MTIQDSLLTEIERHNRAFGLSETAFGVLAVNDGKLISRLRSGANMTLRTLGRVREYLDANPIDISQSNATNAEAA